MCKLKLPLLPPFCGSKDAPCGEECCQPDCVGRQCGEDPNCHLSCGVCEPNNFCSSDRQCRLDPNVLLCEGDLRIAGPEIPIEVVDGGPMPIAEGGTIADGIYDLVATRQYVPSSFLHTFVRAAMRLFAGATKAELIFEGTGFTALYGPHELIDVAAEGTTLRLAPTCPTYSTGTLTIGNMTLGYSVVGSELWLIQPGQVEVYAPRP